MIKFLIALSFVVFTVLVQANEVATGSTATPEDQIPLRMTASEKNPTETSTGQKMLVSFGLIAALAGAGYYFIKKRSFVNKSSSVNMMQIKILSQHYLGPKKSLAIVRVAGESMLIGITDQSINMIKSLSLLDDELPVTTPEDFKNVLGVDGQINLQADSQADSDEDFTFSGVKTTVFQKIKSMRNIQ